MMAAQAALGPIDMIWHLAANSDIATGNTSASIDLKRTFQTTCATVEAAKALNVRAIAFASTSAVYGDNDGLLSETTGPLLPISNYGAMKLASEATLSAAAEALSGMGTEFGQSIVNGNAILDDINPQMGQVRYDLQRLTQLANVYSSASPDLFNALDNAVTTAHTLNQQRGELDAALLASIGFGNTGADVFERGAPYLVRGQADLVPSAQLLDKYSPELYCSIRNIAEVGPAAEASFGGNGYSLITVTELLGAPNPYVYPDNLPRVNARGGPGGAPGCWQKIDRNFWPAPYVVMDTGASIAPYNHFELGQPLANE